MEVGSLFHSQLKNPNSYKPYTAVQPFCDKSGAFWLKTDLHMEAPLFVWDVHLLAVLLTNVAIVSSPD